MDTIRHKHTPIRKQGLGQSSTNGTHEDTAAVEELNKYEAVVGKNREKMIQTCQQTQYEFREIIRTFKTSYWCTTKIASQRKNLMERFVMQELSGVHW